MILENVGKFIATISIILWSLIPLYLNMDEPR